MRIVNAEIIEHFAAKHARAAKPLTRWKISAGAAQWQTFADVRKQFPATDMVKPHTLIFNIGGNNFRLVVKAFFDDGDLVILGVHTHAEYDKLNLR